MSAKESFRKIILLFVLLMLLAVHAFLVDIGWKGRKLNDSYRVVPKLNLQWMKFISLDQERFVSQLLSLYLLSASPLDCNEWDYKGLLSYLRVITGLDPYNKDPFFFALYIMSYRRDNDGRLIFNYIDDTMSKYPYDWKLPWQASYVAKLKFKDNHLAYWYALKAANTPGAPPIIRILPAMLAKKNLRNIEMAYAYLNVLRAHSTDPKEIEAINKEIEKLSNKN